MLTQTQLKAQFHYNPETGDFHRKTRQGIYAPGLVNNAPNKDGYIPMKVEGKIYVAHRLAYLYMLGRFPSRDMDHINHTKTDNRWVNLRAVTPAENARNQPLMKRNTSGVCGVYWLKKSRCWRASIKTKGKRISVGRFKCFKDAVAARHAAEEKYGFHPNHGGPYENLGGNANNNMPRKVNASGVPGLCWREKKQAYQVRIGRVCIGSSNNLFEAVCLRKSAEVKNLL